ncbi:MAG: tRNA adenylyltransferase, partial [Planctomycetaceae bacterium]|nr:tRNA adenylyltransferase [Planctomycetaceae bacterium]
KKKPPRRVCQGWVKPWDLPTNGEIREQLLSFSRTPMQTQPDDQLQVMRITALALMQRLSAFRPRLVGSVLAGQVRQGSDINLHLFAASLEAITSILDEDLASYDVDQKTIHKEGQARHYVHVHLQGTFPTKLTVYPHNVANVTLTCPITGGPMQHASIAELELLIEREYPELDLEEQLADLDDAPDRFALYLALLLPLENVRQKPSLHPEGDALYHSLQVFQLASQERPYDEEFLTAALLHDLGKAIDPDDPLAAAMEALEGFITERTTWLIENLPDAHRLAEGTIGSRHRKRLAADESYEELVLLAECDRNGRQPGAEAPELEEALDQLRELDQQT